MAWALPARGATTDVAGGDSAKQLFEKMEERLSQAKTVKCDLNIHFDGSGEPGAPVRHVDYISSFALADGNRARLELKKAKAEAADVPGVPFLLIISDGRRQLHQDSGMPKPQIHRATESTNADLTALVSRSGFFLSTLPLPDVQVKSMKDRFPVSEFKLGPKERIGDLMAQRVDYRFDVAGRKGPNGEDAPFRASVWIDSDNMLPLKRTITWNFGGFQVASTGETYKDIAVDKKIDPDKFQLTKN